MEEWGEIETRTSRLELKRISVDMLTDEPFCRPNESREAIKKRR